VRKALASGAYISLCRILLWVNAHICKSAFILLHGNIIEVDDGFGEQTRIEVDSSSEAVWKMEKGDGVGSRPKEPVDCGLNHHRGVSAKGSDVHFDAQYCGYREIHVDRMRWRI
jgi:hypothetical protein